MSQVNLIPHPNEDLISVIITCYNHGDYLSKAIESVLEQTAVQVEVLVVDDGSTDATKEVASQYPAVAYIYQTNSGVSVARNTGISNCKGSYMVFLDADDWLLPNALANNLYFFKQNRSLGFVCGAFTNYYVNTENQKTVYREKEEFSYKSLLHKNYVGMLSSVMFPRSVFDHLLFDKEMRSCEDWELYLKIARKFPILHHTTPIAVYRRYDTSKSSALGQVLVSGLEALNRQKDQVMNTEEWLALQTGIQRWKNLYTTKMYLKLLDLLPHAKTDKEMLHFLYQYHKVLYIKYKLRKMGYSVYSKFALNQLLKIVKQ